MSSISFEYIISRVTLRGLRVLAHAVPYVRREGYLAMVTCAITSFDEIQTVPQKLFVFILLFFEVHSSASHLARATSAETWISMCLSRITLRGLPAQAWTGSPADPDRVHPYTSYLARATSASMWGLPCVN